MDNVERYIILYLYRDTLGPAKVWAKGGLKLILESDVEKYLVKKFGGLGKVFKWVSPGIKGVPDRIIFLPGGKILLVELKRPKSKPRATQLIIHKMLARLGTKVWVVDSKEGVDKLYELHRGCKK